MIDLRSDTVTRPTPAMREAIASAEVGDDAHGDDPTVLALERRTAEILGTEAAVYMPSGTMTNQVAIRVHTEAGDQILLEENAHSYLYEAGGPAALAGVMIHPLQGTGGLLSPQQVEAAIRPAAEVFAPDTMLAIENTVNVAGGIVYPLERIIELGAVAGKHHLKFHMDGARLWNATAATGIPEAEYARHFDSISVCFSKGLGAPVGSALAGSAALVARARRFRKQFGGAMRQAGIIAAGALYALEHHRERLIDDHRNARRLAEGLLDVPDLEIDMQAVETNIVNCRIPSCRAEAYAERLHAAGVYVLALDPDRIRVVTSLAVTEADIDRAVQVFHEVFRNGA